MSSAKPSKYSLQFDSWKKLESFALAGLEDIVEHWFLVDTKDEMLLPEEEQQSTLFGNSIMELPSILFGCPRRSQGRVISGVTLSSLWGLLLSTNSVTSYLRKVESSINLILQLARTLLSGYRNWQPEHMNSHALCWSHSPKVSSHKTFSFCFMTATTNTSMKEVFFTLIFKISPSLPCFIILFMLFSSVQNF